MNKRRKTLVWIVRYFADNGYWPTLREIAAGLGLKHASGAAYQLRRLAAEGLASDSAAGEPAARVMFIAGLSPLLRETAAKWLESFSKEQEHGEVA